MGKRKWRSAKTPPDSDRLVRLRINKPGNGDDRLYFIGWYVAELGGYVLTRKNIYDRVFIVPTHWSEIE